MVDAWQAVMDPERNPLRRLPKVVTFQLMTVLAWMWCTVFSLWIGAMWLLGPSILVHTVLLLGVFFTAAVFGHFDGDGRNDETSAGTRRPRTPAGLGRPQ